jgi:hypothetical protein
VASEPGVSTPTRVIVARLRTSAVIGMSSAARPDLRRAEVLRADSLARQPVVADELGRLLRGVRDLDADEALDQRRQALRVTAARDPLEQAAVLVRDRERRVCPPDTDRAGWARRSRSRCVTPSRRRYLTAW